MQSLTRWLPIASLPTSYRLKNKSVVLTKVFQKLSWLTKNNKKTGPCQNGSDDGQCTPHFDAHTYLCMV